MKIVVTVLLIMTGIMTGTGKFESDVFKTKDGKELKITFIKHGSLMFEFDGKIMYVDPVSDYADYTKLPKADVILITHEHGDHLDPKAISVVEKEGTILIANANSQKKLGKGVVMKNGDRLQPAGWFTLDAVPAYNTTPGREIYHPKDRDNGYVLTFGGTRVYIAGDTEDIPEMQKLKDIDIAFLPVNQPYTMTVPQADHAARMVNPRVLYPYHYGDTNVAELKSSLKDVPGIDVRIRQLQ
ncbi:MBL fold metallo-hydrolase [Butyricimonas paravirosa]|uniref:MBL fold metallo-hydrolase n=1 Tax=Butyricimonas paravirosa TaxID=1472417 RepID=UPI00210B6A00|nr:MBL fold metallo-hydrolase [Butyricimonas paravirosa]MCQ4874004.1 MBL fold metallo-hydrolase [Butyricimonas paravirosa]